MTTTDAPDSATDGAPDARSGRASDDHHDGEGPGLPLRVARDLLTVRRVFGEPIVEGDVTIVPVARVMGGSGYGDGDGQWNTRGQVAEGIGSGSGGGFGAWVSPVGVYVVRGSDVTWQPALDLGRVILGGQVAGIVAILAITRIIRRRRR